jgi:hypothetical protein
MQRSQRGLKRKVTYDKSHPYTPWMVRVRIGPRRLKLGRYKTEAEAKAAEKGARKVVPAKSTWPLRIPDDRRQAIRATSQLTRSQRQTARIHGVARRTVQVILQEADD